MSEGDGFDFVIGRGKAWAARKVWSYINPCYFLICFAQTKIALFTFFNNWLSKGKRKFSASRTVFSCNTLRGNKVTIFLS